MCGLIISFLFFLFIDFELIQSSLIPKVVFAATHRATILQQLAGDSATFDCVSALIEMVKDTLSRLFLPTVSAGENILLLQFERNLKEFLGVDFLQFCLLAASIS